MKLRKLEQKDAPLMLEWMHDETVTKGLQAVFASKTPADCKAFINAAADTSIDLHLAVADEHDAYMGTVSLKHMQENAAEFAITVRREAMGKGYSGYAMHEMIRIGFEEKNPDRIYWCVKPENRRAIRFYDKNGYRRVDAAALKIIGGGGKPRTDFRLPLVSGNKGNYGRRSLPGRRTFLKQLHTKTLFLPGTITTNSEGKEDERV